MFFFCHSQGGAWWTRKIEKKKMVEWCFLRSAIFIRTTPGRSPSSAGRRRRRAWGGLQNPRGWAFLRVVLWKLLGGERVPLYDQPVIVENAGAIVLCRLGDRIGLVRNFRMVGERLLPRSGSEYIIRLQTEDLWANLVGSLGEWKWEVPRGLITTEPGEMDLVEFIVKSAKLEALEEAGFRISKARVRGRINVNPTFFLHSQFVVEAQIDSVGRARPEDLEIIGDSRLFTPVQLRVLVDSGELDDGLTLGALALCGISF